MYSRLVRPWALTVLCAAATLPSLSHALEQQRLVAPIAITQQAENFRDVAKENMRWCDRVLITPFRERNLNQPWFLEASRFVTEACRGTAPGPDYESPELLEQGRQLINRGCNDPLVLWLVAHSDVDDWQPRHGKAHVLLEKAADAAEKLPGSKALYWLISRELLASTGDLPLNDPLVQRCIGLTKEVMKDGSFLPTEDRLFYIHLCLLDPAGLMGRFGDAMTDTSEPSPLGEWIHLLLRGVREIQLAWQARGTGYASEVSEEQWRGFGEHLKPAREALTAAWKLNPKRPEAAAEMITVVMGERETNEETTRLWFDRAISAQCDYDPAYRQLMHAYRPEWGGSHAKMLALGQACLDTGRFDLPIPQVYSYALTQIVRNGMENVITGQEYKAVYRDRPEIGQQLVQLALNILATPSRQKDRAHHLANLAISAWFAGDLELAKKTRAEIPGRMPLASVRRLERNGVKPEVFEQELAQLGAPGAAVYDTALARYATRDYAEAAKLLAQAMPALPAEKKAAARALLAAVQLEEPLATGNWVPLKPAVDESIWFTNPPQDLRGLLNPPPPTPDYPAAPAKAPLNSVAPVGDRFEWRWTLPEAAKAPQPGDVLHRFFLSVRNGTKPPPFIASRWVSFEIRAAYAPGQGQLTLLDLFDGPLGQPAVFPLTEKPQILVRYAGRSVTVEINGKPILKNATLPSPTYGLTTVVIGYDRKNSDELPVAELEVRRIDLPPPPKSPRPAA